MPDKWSLCLIRIASLVGLAGYQLSVQSTLQQE